MPRARPQIAEMRREIKTLRGELAIRRRFYEIANRLDRLEAAPRALRQVCTRCERAAAVARVRTAAATCHRSVGLGSLEGSTAAAVVDGCRRTLTITGSIVRKCAMRDALGSRALLSERRN